MINALLIGGLVLPVHRCIRWRMAVARALHVVSLVVLVLVAADVRCARAQDAPASTPATERSVKAAFLYKFLAYVDWPASAFPQPDTPITIGVLGADAIAAELQQITNGRTVNDRPIAVRRMREGESVAGLNVLFVGRADKGRLPQLARTAQARSVLTVTENAGGLEQGSVINFLIAEGRVRFEISVEAAERSGLKLSSRLLAVAQLVRTGS